MKVYALTILLLLLFPFASPKAIEFLVSSPKGDNGEVLHRNKPRVANIIFKSADGGQSWQDVSEGLPQDLLSVGLAREGLFADEHGLYLRAGDNLYLSTPNATTPFWKKQNSSYGCSSMALTKGSIKSTNGGKTWKQAHTGGRIMKVVESNGVLMTTSQEGILRSTDEGESWDLVLSEGGVGIAVERIKGGFAAITYNTASKTRRVRTSYDGGKSWQPIDAGLSASQLIASIIEVGDYFFCGHPSGIYRSADKGKTWKLLLPSVENKVFHLLVSGKMIYAIPREGGC